MLPSLLACQRRDGCICQVDPIPNETRLKPPLALEWEYKTGSKI